MDSRASAHAARSAMRWLRLRALSGIVGTALTAATACDDASTPVRSTWAIQVDASPVDLVYDENNVDVRTVRASAFGPFGQRQVRGGFNWTTTYRRRGAIDILELHSSSDSILVFPTEDAGFDTILVTAGGNSALVPASVRRGTIGARRVCSEWTDIAAGQVANGVITTTSCPWRRGGVRLGAQYRYVATSSIMRVDVLASPTDSAWPDIHPALADPQGSLGNAAGWDGFRDGQLDSVGVRVLTRAGEHHRIRVEERFGQPFHFAIRVRDALGDVDCTPAVALLGAVAEMSISQACRDDEQWIFVPVPAGGSVRLLVVSMEVSPTAYLKSLGGDKLLAETRERRGGATVSADTLELIYPRSGERATVDLLALIVGGGGKYGRYQLSISER